MQLPGITPVAATFALAVAAAVSTGVGAYWSSRAVAEATEWVSHSHQVQRTLEEVHSLLAEAESSQRGFVLTNNAEYLGPYRQATRSLPGTMAALQTLTADNAVQQQRIPGLRQLATERLQLSAKIIQLMEDGDRDTALDTVVGGRGLQVMQRFRAEIATMQAEEARLLDRRLLEAEDARRNGATVAAITTVLLMTLLATVYATAVRTGKRVGALLEASEADRLELRRSLDELRSAREQVGQLNADLERRVEERTRQLSEANEELEAFSYTVSHDLRAPLRAMQGFAQAVHEDYADRLDAEGRGYLERIMAAARRMEGLIQDLLEYGRLAREDLQLREVSLELAVREAVTQVSADLERRGGRIDADSPLPDVRAHPAVLLQVVSNLVGNAIKFVVPGQPPQVRIWAERVGGCVRTFVQDRGIGIRPEHQDRIFRVFERLHGQESYPGTGVGLAIVRKGCERMGGRCGLASEPGSGSTFWFELPAAQA